MKKLPFPELKGLYMLHGQHMAPGEQLNINHEACPAGIDTKKRLNMRKTDDGYYYLARCNHCGFGGRYALSIKTRKDAHRKTSCDASKPKLQCRIPDDACGDSTLWPDRAREWTEQYGITDSELRGNNICYSELYDRLILPIYRDGKLKCFQTRRLEGGKGPKYLTYTDGTGDNYMFINNNSDTLVITEDILSAIKVARYASSLALLSTSLSSGALSFIAGQEYTRCFIWLDHDNASVRSAERKLMNDVSVFIDDVEIVTLSDPKRCSDCVIRETLEVSPLYV